MQNTKEIISNSDSQAKIPSRNHSPTTKTCIEKVLQNAKHIIQELAVFFVMPRDLITTQIGGRFIMELLQTIYLLFMSQEQLLPQNMVSSQLDKRFSLYKYITYLYLNIERNISPGHTIQRRTHMLFYFTFVYIIQKDIL